MWGFFLIKELRTEEEEGAKCRKECKHNISDAHDQNSNTQGVGFLNKKLRTEEEEGAECRKECKHNMSDAHDQNSNTQGVGFFK